MNISVTLTGNIDEIKMVLDLLDENRTDESTLGSTSGIDTIRFISLLSDAGRRAVASLAIRSAHDQQFTRVQWQSDSEVPDPDEFNGVLGGIGRAWAKVSKMPNPFSSQGVNSTGEHLHFIKDRRLADDLHRILTDRFS